MGTKKIIKFYASWCGPCKIYSKAWDKVIPSYSDQVDFFDVHIDKDTTGLANKYKIDTVPTTVLIREDGSSKLLEGRLNQTELTELILS